MENGPLKKMIYRDLPLKNGVFFRVENSWTTTVDPGAGLQANKPPKSAVLIHWATKSVQLIGLYIE